MLGKLGGVLLIGLYLVAGAQAMAQSEPEPPHQKQVLAQLPGPPFGLGPGGPPMFFATRGCGGSNAGGPLLMPPPPEHMIGMAPLMIPPGVINLTDDQIDQLARLKDSTSEKAAPILTSLRSLEHSRHIALNETELNVAEISKLNSNISAQKQLLDSVMADSMLKAAQTLTPDQRKKLKLDMQRHELGQFEEHKPSASSTEHH